jgi:anti-anti-sigma factor
MNDSQLTVSVTQEMFAGALVEVAGEIDIATSGELEARLTQLIADGRPRLLVDLAGVHFCDSSGLRALLNTRERADADGGMFQLIAPQPIVAKAISVTGLDQVFDIVADRPAISGYHAGGPPFGPAEPAVRRFEPAPAAPVEAAGCGE